MLLVAPILIPLLTACLALLAWRSRFWGRFLGVAGAFALLLAGLALAGEVWRKGLLTTQAGGWPAPFGITLQADLFAALMVVLAGLIGAASAAYGVADVPGGRRWLGFYPMLHALLFGVCGAFLTGDLFNLFVWFEVLLMGSFVLMALGAARPSLVATVKYFAFNFFGSTVFLVAVGLIYSKARSLNMADLSARLAVLAADEPTTVYAFAALLGTAFGIKAAVFPLHFWLPASYPAPPAGIAALFAGLLTKVGVYALLRVFTLVLPPLPIAYNTILAIACATMVVGVLGAVAQKEISRILSFHIISQIGYMVLGLALLGAADERVRRLGLAASIFYIAHHILVKANLFLVGGLVEALRGTARLRDLGGLARGAPWLAALFLVPALSLAGLPPLSGFWAKFNLIRAALLGDGALAVAVGVALAVGLLTLLSMMKIWTEAFWKPLPADAAAHVVSPATARTLRWRIGPIVALAALTVAIGFYPQPLWNFAERAAAQMLAPGAYVAELGLAAAGPGGQEESQP